MLPNDTDLPCLLRDSPTVEPTIEFCAHDGTPSRTGGKIISGLGALWNNLTHPQRYPTPQSTIEAILHSVRTRGIAALEEPDIVERLSRCDEAALDEIKRRCLRRS